MLPPLGGGDEPAGVGGAGPQDPGAVATTRRKDVVGGEVRVTRSTLNSSPLLLSEEMEEPRDGASEEGSSSLRTPARSV